MVEGSCIYDDIEEDSSSDYNKAVNKIIVF